MRVNFRERSRLCVRPMAIDRFVSRIRTMSTSIFRYLARVRTSGRFRLTIRLGLGLGFMLG
jgi:hypothetical protein